MPNKKHLTGMVDYLVITSNDSYATVDVNATVNHRNKISLYSLGSNKFHYSCSCAKWKIKWPRTTVTIL
jgi:hypothetical protein